MEVEVIGATRVISRRVASELEEYAQSKDPRVLDNLLFLCERMYRLILAVEDHGGGGGQSAGEAAQLVATAITVLQVSKQ